MTKEQLDNKIITQKEDMLNDPKKYNSTGYDLWKARKELQAMGLDDSDHQDSNSHLSDR